MNRIHLLLTVVALAGGTALIQDGTATDRNPAADRRDPGPDAAAVRGDLQPDSVAIREAGDTAWAQDSVAFSEAADAAWAFLVRNRFEETGLVGATESYEHITTWDIGSLILGLYAARELGLASEEEGREWMETLLATLNRVDLFDGGAYNKSYSARSARMIDNRDRPSDRGKGWSALDLGRLLVALRVVEEAYPEHAGAARAAVARIDFERTIDAGYIVGAEPRGQDVIYYPEGRIGYEQYAARGFALWGHEADAALDLMRNAEPVEVMGHTILSDRRGRDRLTSEPFILSGMEMGWGHADFEELARTVLSLQEARWRETGQVTMVSEDAIQQPPHYFYYYTVYSEGEPFAVRAHGPVQNPPRWISSKAAYAWHALLPDDYTARAVEAVQPARSSTGWASGVFEGSGRSTAVRNLNSAAIILEAALFRERGRPFLESGVDAGR